MVVPSPEGRRLSSSYSSPRPASSTSLLRKPPVSRKPYSLPHTLPPIPPPLPHPPRSHPRPPRPPRPPTFPPQSRPLHSLTSPPIIPSSPPPPLPTPPPLPQSILPPSPPSLMSTLAFLDAIDSVTSITYLISMCGNNPVSDVGVRGGVCLNLGHATACIWASAILGPHSGPKKVKFLKCSHLRRSGLNRQAPLRQTPLRRWWAASHMARHHSHAGKPECGWLALRPTQIVSLLLLLLH